jgi:phosphoenolpyruvate carboxykinase (GTP)
MEWILKRCTGQIGAQESPIGYLPNAQDLNLEGANVDAATMRELLAVQPDAWRRESAEMREYLKEFGSRTPAEMSAEIAEIEKRLG